MAICFLATLSWASGWSVEGKRKAMFAQSARCLCRTLAKATCPSCLLECRSTCQAVNHWRWEDKTVLKGCVLLKSSDFCWLSSLVCCLAVFLGREACCATFIADAMRERLPVLFEIEMEEKRQHSEINESPCLFARTVGRFFSFSFFLFGREFILFWFCSSSFSGHLYCKFSTSPYAITPEQIQLRALHLLLRSSLIKQVTSIRYGRKLTPNGRPFTAPLFPLGERNTLYSSLPQGAKSEFGCQRQIQCSGGSIQRPAAAQPRTFPFGVTDP